MKSIHYLLAVLLPMMLNAADERADTILFKIENFGSAQPSQIVSMIRNRRTHNVAQQTDLSGIETAEVSAAIEELEIETSKEYREWLKNNEDKVCCCGIVLPMLLPMATVSTLTYSALNALNLYSTEPLANDGMPVGAAISAAFGVVLGGAASIPLIDKISEYIKPDQSEKTAQIKRLQIELDSRKNK